MTFKINYKGSGIELKYEYKCASCELVHEVFFLPKDKPDTIDCTCGGTCNTHYSKAPACDADFRQAGLFANRDWD